MRLLRLTLTDFRTYGTLVWRPAARLVVVSGPNGSGKTNLLEAVSLLAPGRGLRGARFGELARHGASSWAVAARLEDVDIGTGTLPGTAERRVFRLDGAAPRNQAEIAARTPMVWLTPQMDRLFQEPASGRRRFLDRLVWSLEPAHAREVAAHDNALAQRNRLLARGGADPAWLAGVEDALARHAVAVTASRMALVARLAIVSDAIAGFPAARMTLLCPIAERLEAGAALAAEDWLRATLAASRATDAAAGSTAQGAHRADMALADAATGLPASQASTGQQKALLIATILAHAALVGEARAAPPLLLLDEPMVHLDTTRRAALLAALDALPGQAILTGVEPDPFRPLGADARFVEAGDGTLRDLAP